MSATIEKTHINKKIGDFRTLFTNIYKILTILAADGTFKLLLTNFLKFYQFYLISTISQQSVDQTLLESCVI